MNTSIVIEKLPAEGFGILAHIDDGFTPDPRYSIALIAKGGDEVIGRVFLVAPVHVEGPWVSPLWRGSPVGKRLLDEVERQAKELKVSKVIAYARDEQIENYLSRLGYKRMPLTVWEKEI